MSYAFPAGASPSYPPQQLPSASGRYSPQPGYAPPLHGGQPVYGAPQTYSAQGGYSAQTGAYGTQTSAYGAQAGQPGGYARSASPQPGMAPAPPTAQQPIQPGSITYTTSTGPDGRVVYHPFKAVPASYQTPQGVVSGIQWIPAEATNVLPAGAQPADSSFAASWNRGHLSDDEKRSIEKWQRDEEKRRRRDEKEAAKRVHEWESQRREREKEVEREDRELRKARERDAGGYRERRKSTNGPSPYMGSSPIPVGALPGTAGTIPGGYGAGTAYSAGGYDHERKYSAGGSPDIARGMADMNLGGYGHERKSSSGFAMPRSRRGSINAGVLEAAARAGSDVSDRAPGYGARPYAAGGTYTASSYGAPATVPARPLSRQGGEPYMNRSPLPGEAPLPNAPVYGVPSSYGTSEAGRRGTDPYGRPVSPFAGGAPPGSETTYPRGHVLEGQPMPRSPIPGVPASAAYGVPAGYAGSAASGAGMPPIVGYPTGGTSRPPSRLSGAGYGAAGAMPEPQGPLMAAPEGFSRPPNRSQPYTPFEPVRINALDEMVEHMPRMPMVLVPHDVYHQDWIRFMTDVVLAWTDPGRVGRTRPSSGVADLVELWNSQFFGPRSVEVVLYKGAERRTGPDAGQIDREVLEYDVSSSSEEEEEDSDVSDRGGYGGAYGGGMYGRGADAQMAQMREARRARRAEAQAEKRRKRKEKKMRRRAREQERTYSLYLTYTPAGTGGDVSRAPLYVGM